jgi:MOSC domain-containing protein YiiM
MDKKGDGAGAGRLLSIQSGRVREMAKPAVWEDGREGVWTSGIFKSAVAGPVEVTQAGIVGDQQADLRNHGGPDNVVLAYDGGHYEVWRRELGLAELGHGSFGENFTVEGFTDAEVCIGDVWVVGEQLQLQVTQARQPCFKLARRLQRVDIVQRVKANSWGGWYLRVLQPGAAEAGMAIRLVNRRHTPWTVARAVQTMYNRKKDLAAARELAALPELSARWKRELLD